MSRIIYCILFLCCTAIPLSALSIKDMWRDLSEGDFIVTHQEKNYTLLRVYSVSTSSYILEEITAPEFAINAKTTIWNTWLQEGAPGHTAWVAYEIDKNTNHLLSLYSFDRHLWLQPQEEHLLFLQLLHLNFTAVLEKERKKIGPPSPQDELDTRALWIPPVIYEGMKKIKPRIEAWRAHWPDDNSPLSGAHIELYWNPPFPFPYWLEVQGGHYTFKVHAVDSGKHLLSPQKLPPRLV